MLGVHCAISAIGQSGFPAAIGYMEPTMVTCYNKNTNKIYKFIGITNYVEMVKKTCYENLTECVWYC